MRHSDKTIVLQINTTNGALKHIVVCGDNCSRFFAADTAPYRVGAAAPLFGSLGPLFGQGNSDQSLLERHAFQNAFF
jgi:hypothetical protein